MPASHPGVGSSDPAATVGRWSVMGLEVPELDDRTFEELLTDARKRIAVHSDTWTDHNESDPGIAILEVLAWVAESDTYELDRVTDRHVRKYLGLLGVTPRKPRSATVSLALDTPRDLAGGVLPANTPVTATHGGRTYPFRTTHDVVQTDADVTAVVSETAAGRVDNTPANDREDMYFLAFGRDAAEDTVVYVGFDANPFRNADRLDLYVDFHEANLPAPATHGDRDPSFTPSVRVSWEYCTDPTGFHDPANWAPVDDGEDGPTGELRDGTDHLYHGGTVSIPKPAGWPADPEATTPFDRDEPHHWLRARIVESGHEVPPQLNAFETGVVEAHHRRARTNVRLTEIPDGMTPETARERPGGPGETTARPGQAFAFPDAPVLDADVVVGGDDWNVVDDFDASGPDATDVVLDHERGVVRFGDGVRGEIPRPGQPVTATRYEYGGGDAGNLPADADWQLDTPASPAQTVTPRGPATGGSDAESLDAALARLKRDLRTPHRGVTLDDYRYLATHTPGLRFGRAAVHVRSDDAGASPSASAGESHGTANDSGRSVVAVVVPYSPSYRTRPEPSPGFLDAVSCHLERHRLLTDRVTVEGPTYVGISIDAVIEVATGSAERHTIEAVEDALAGFLDPLEGFEGDGWPFGRPVYLSEVYETIESVSGVDCVRDVDLTPHGPGSRIDAGIAVPATALVDLLAADVRTAGTGDRCEVWSR